MMRKIVIATAFCALLGGTSLALADDQPANDPARHRMGDEGKLPATNSVTTRVPDQGASTGESSGTTGSIPSVELKPSRFLPTPCWKTRTSTP